jgi:1-acyl-sn-glycerol-3-phosphate acyltransferase
VDERRARAAKPGLLSNLLFCALWLGCSLLLRLWLRLSVRGRPRLRGAFVLAANHASFLDPLLLGVAVPRRIVYMMTEIVWRSPAAGWLYRWSGAIPVSVRGQNRDALRAARSALQHGRVVGIFPEGGISRDGALMLGSPGAVSLVLNEGVPIVPVGIVGASRALPLGCALPRPRRVEVRFGAPILPAELEALAPGDRKARLQAATRLIMERIAQLTGQEARETWLARQVAARAAAGT